MNDVLLTTTAEVQPEAEAAVEEPAAAQDTGTEPESSAMAATPAGETETSTDNAASPEEDGQFFTVKHNKRLLSLSRDDVMDYAQKGIKYDELQPVLDTLKYVAASEGKTLTELVEAIRKQNEETVFSRLLDRCGDEEIARELLEAEKSKHRSAYESFLERERNEESETEEAVTRRMAEEFEELRKDFPQYTSFDKVPPLIVREAVERGISLLDANLRYEHRQRAKAAAAETAQSAAAKTSTGSQQSAGMEQPSAVEAAFMKGLWG